jgi:cytochrome c-type biogenesis protein CcmH
VRRALAVLALAAALLVAPAALASEERPTLRELEAEVMCPTCNTVLEVSDAPVAERMRIFIGSRISAGDTKSEIKDRLVAQFGEGVLAAPRRRGLGLLAWLAPVSALVLGSAFLAARGRRKARVHADAAAERLDEETEAALALAVAEADR